MKLFSKYFKLCDHYLSKLETDRWTICNRKTVLCTTEHRVLKTLDDSIPSSLVSMSVNSVSINTNFLRLCPLLRRPAYNKFRPHFHHLQYNAVVFLVYETQKCCILFYTMHRGHNGICANRNMLYFFCNTIYI